MAQTILVATRNKGKAAEFNTILSKYDVKILTLLDTDLKAEIIEDGLTFKDNAVKKSKTVFEQTGHITAADDSGLEIDFLGGSPGVNSARFEGYSTPYEIKNEKILEKMKDVPDEQRTARFKCVIAYSDGNGTETFEGVCNGKISRERRGKSGFGYDPVFMPAGYDKTFGELGEEIKNKISHRAVALNKFYKWFVKNRLDSK